MMGGGGWVLRRAELGTNPPGMGCNGIPSASGRYAIYWNAVLFIMFSICLDMLFKFTT